MKVQILQISLAAGLSLGWLTARAQTEQRPPDRPPVTEETSTNAPVPAEAPPEVGPPPEVEMPPEPAEPAMWGEDEPAPSASATGSTSVAQTPSPTEPPPAAATPAAFPPPAESVNGSDELRLNFRGAPIEMVLNYLSDAAGLIIELDTPVRGQLDVWSGQPVSKEEAVDILTSALNKNGYAAVRNGRTLTIMSKDDALHSDIPVKVSDNPDSIPKNDEIATVIMPIQFVDATQLIKDLAPLVSPHAAILANQAGNSVVITDTQANIRHLAEVIKAINSSAADVTEVRVFPLKYHDPVEIANLLTSLFSGQDTTGGNQMPIRLSSRSGFGGGFSRFMAAAMPANNNSQTDRMKKRQQVVAVADARTSSVVVTASKDLIAQIAGMIEQLDQESPKVAHVSVIHLENADPQQVQQVLQDMFQSGTASRNASSQSSPLMNRIQQNQSSSSTGTGMGTAGMGTAGRGTSRNGLSGTSF